MYKKRENFLNKNLITFILPSLEMGGAEKITINLIDGFLNSNYKIDLILINATGFLLRNLPNECNVINFRTKRASLSLFKFIKYLKANKPILLISSLTHINLISIISVLLSRVKTKILIIEHSNLSSVLKYNNSLKIKIIYLLAKLFYRKANSIVAVSNGVKEDLAKKIPSIKDKIEVIYNPIIRKEIFEMSLEKVEKEWFLEKKEPIIISIGRLSKEKDYSTLLKAFKIVREKIRCKLVIIGDGKERKNLEDLAKKLSIIDHFWISGFENNPYKYLKRADIFVLTSIYEGFSNVLVEALAFGLPIIATECESGPKEIVLNSKNGILVKVGDYKGLSEAILEILLNKKSFKIDRNYLNKFYQEEVIKRYKILIENLIES